MPCYLEFLKTASVCVVGIQLIFGVFRWCYGNIVGPYFLNPKSFRQYGNWALVTGATDDGIGKQYAISVRNKRLFEKDFLHGLISAGKAWLEHHSRVTNTPQIGVGCKGNFRDFRVETQVITVDFTSGPEIYDQIKQEIEGKEIGILVNNVGMFHPAPDFFLNIPDREKVIQDIIRCNVTSISMMCSLICPQMIQRKRGLIISISSLASVIPGPSMIIYSATNACVSKFSSDLGAEYEDQGIDVPVLRAGSVSTNRNKVIGGTFTVPTASQYVESAFRYVGYSRCTTGFFAHSLLDISCQFTNFIAPRFTEGLVKKQMLAVRDKAIKILIMPNVA